MWLTFVVVKLDIELIYDTDGNLRKGMTTLPENVEIFDKYRLDLVKLTIASIGRNWVGEVLKSRTQKRPLRYFNAYSQNAWKNLKQY